MDVGNHREHDPKRSAIGCPQEGLGLHFQNAGAIQAKADCAPAKGGIIFGQLLEEGQHLIRANIERSEGYRFAIRFAQYVAVEAGLFFSRRHPAIEHKVKFGAQKTDAFRAALR